MSLSDDRDFRNSGEPSGFDSCNQLGPRDAEALDALCEAGFSVDAVPANLRERAHRVATVLGLLDSCARDGAGSDGLLVDATLARVAVARSELIAPGVFNGTELIPDDEDAVELLVSSGFHAKRVPSRVRARAQRIAQLLNLLDAHTDTAGRETLVQATLSRVQTSLDARDVRMRFDDHPVVTRRIRIGDLVSIAAMLTLAASVLFPLAGAVRESSRRASCQSNMAQAGLGFGFYANDYKDSLPLASASTAGNSWWDVGTKPDRSNSANLFTLARTGYSKSQDLACPGNPGACVQQPEPGQFDWRSIDQVSYSYQNLFAKDRPRWVGPVTFVVIADHSPIIPLAIRGEKINPLSNSLQHDGRGQSVMFNDTSVKWLRTPVLASGDNIYLPRALEELIARLQRLHDADPLKGTETPSGADDVFLAP